ncbi:hypothetical protein JKY72_07005 [Candidatus Gracilibacteria bacterium]|nr:hypothetical protein [Candidatus Gracilibacteria bacterium]
MKRNIGLLVLFGMFGSEASLFAQPDINMHHTYDAADINVNHTHVVKTSGNESSFDEMLESVKRNVAPGVATGIIEGITEACLSLGRNEIDDSRIVAAIIASDVAGSVSSLCAEAWRKNPEQFLQIDEGAGSYFAEKSIHNTIKYLTGLVVIDMLAEDDGVSAKSKKLLLEKWVNNLSRGRQISEKVTSQILCEGALRTVTEGFFIEEGNGSEDKMVWNPILGLSSFAGSFCGEQLANLFVDGKSDSKVKLKRAQRLRRLASTLGGSFMKVIAHDKVKKWNYEGMELVNDSLLLQATPFLIGGGIISGFALVAPLKGSTQSAKFLKSLIDIIGSIAKVVKIFHQK